MSPEAWEHRQHRRPLWLAALVTTFVAPMPYVAYEALQLFADTGSLGGDTYMASPLFGIAVAGFMVSAFSMYVVGLPVVLWLRREQKLLFGYLCLAAAAAGVAGILALILAFKFELHPALLVFGAGLGAVAGCVFGLVAGVRIRETRESSP